MLKTFIHESVNKPFIKAVLVPVLGQGLYGTYDVILVGNKYNRYIMNVEYLGKRGTIIFEEKHIEEWRVMDHPENGTLRDSFKFDGFGTLDGNYYNFTNKHNDFDHLYVNGIKITIKNVIVENNGNDSIDRTHEDWTNVCNDEINKTRKETLEIYKNMKKVDYDSFIKESGKYCMINDREAICFDKKRSYVSEGTHRSEIIINDNIIAKHTGFLFEDNDTFNHTAHIEFNYTDSLGIPHHVNTYCDFIRLS